MKEKVRVETETLKEMNNNLIKEKEILETMYGEIVRKLENSKEMLITESGEVFRNKVIEYMQKEREETGKSLDEFINVMKKVIEIYEETKGKINSEVTRLK